MKKQPVLVLLAAGMGSRYGGLKQIDPIDAAGNLIIDFSIYDAIRAGFHDLVFIIKHEIEQDFMDAIGSRISRRANVKCAFQEMNKLPHGLKAPEGRTKPLGTTHALLCARDEIGGRPFAVINSDDYYGPTAYKQLYEFLAGDTPSDEQLMIGYKLENTLTENGSVARGICEVDDEGFLTHIVERRRIFKREHGGAFTEDDGKTFIELPEGTPVSMNCWGFKPDILPMLEDVFKANFEVGIKENPAKYEDLLPNAVQTLMSEGRVRVKVEESPDRWFGVTYKEDKPAVMESIEKIKAQGVYSEKLWD